MGKNCEFFNNSIFLGQSHFLCISLYVLCSMYCLSRLSNIWRIDKESFSYTNNIIQCFLTLGNLPFWDHLDFKKGNLKIRSKTFCSFKLNFWIICSKVIPQFFKSFWIIFQISWINCNNNQHWKFFDLKVITYLVKVNK